jgi:gliding motility-associated-like protein
VQNEPDWNVVLEPMKDTVIIGDIDTVLVQLNGNFDFYWTSDDTIVSYNDTLLITKPVVARDDYAVYYLTVQDTNDCFDYQGEIEIFVKEGYSFGIPEAFTPNGDLINDVIMVNGWGIKQLLEFRIFNRWGNEIFFTDDIHTGWDGTIKNKPQPIDTYAYIIKVELWDGRIVDKTGTFSLIR